MTVNEMFEMIVSLLYSLNLLIFFELPIVGICLLGGLAFAVNTTIGLAMTCDVYQKNLHHGSGRYPYGISMHTN